MNRDSQIVRKLLAFIQNEIMLHTQYLAALAKERDAVTNFNTDKVLTQGYEREALCAKIEEATRLRTQFMQEFPGGENLKLSQFVVRYCTPQDAHTLAPHIKKLREIATATHSKSFEFKQVLEFSQRLVSGTMSILWSATQNVSRIYNARGKIKESYNVTTREQGIIKQA